MKAREKKYFTLGFLSAILSLAVIAFAAAATQGHPWSEIQCDHCLNSPNYFNATGIGACSNICTDNHYDSLALHSCSDCNSQFVNSDGDTMNGGLMMKGDILFDSNKDLIELDMGGHPIHYAAEVSFKDNGKDGKHWDIGESGLNDNTKGKFIIGWIQSGGLNPVFTIDTQGNVNTTTGTVYAHGFKGAYFTGQTFFGMMDCQLVTNEGSSTNSVTVSCPSGYYLVWGGCYSTDSGCDGISTPGWKCNIWDSYCSATEDGPNGRQFCKTWKCTTATGTYIKAQAFCCR